MDQALDPRPKALDSILFLNFCLLVQATAEVPPPYDLDYALALFTSAVDGGNLASHFVP